MCNCQLSCMDVAFVFVGSECLPSPTENGMFLSLWALVSHFHKDKVQLLGAQSYQSLNWFQIYYLYLRPRGPESNPYFATTKTQHLYVKPSLLPPFVNLWFFFFHFQLPVRGIKVHQVLWKFSSHESYTFYSPLQTKVEVFTITVSSSSTRMITITILMYGYYLWYWLTLYMAEIAYDIFLAISSSGIQES